MDLKKLFKKLFPNESDFRNYLRWREHRRRETIRLQKIRQQEDEYRWKMAVMIDDPEDDEFDPVSANIWQEVMNQ